MSSDKHQAILTISSEGPDTEVRVEVKWEPDINGDDIKALGYKPAAYEFVEEFILPALEEAYLKSEYAELLEDSPSTRIN